MKYFGYRKLFAILFVSIFLASFAPQPASAYITNHSAMKSLSVWGGSTQWLTPGITDYNATSWTVVYGTWHLWAGPTLYVKAASATEWVGGATDCYDGSNAGTAQIWCTRW